MQKPKVKKLKKQKQPNQFQKKPVTKQAAQPKNKKTLSQSQLFIKNWVQKGGPASYIYGIHPVVELLKAKNRQVFKVFVTSKNKYHDLQKSYPQIEFKPLYLDVADDFFDSINHQGFFALTTAKPEIDYKKRATYSLTNTSLLLALDQIKDPQNLGAIARAAYIFGADALILPQTKTAALHAAAFKASSGALEHLKILRGNLVDWLNYFKKNDFWVYGANAKAKNTLAQLKPAKKSVLVLGSEAKGLRPLVAKQCDFEFQIKQKNDFDSLSVNQAASIALYHLSQS